MEIVVHIKPHIVEYAASYNVSYKTLYDTAYKNAEELINGSIALFDSCSGFSSLNNDIGTYNWECDRYNKDLYVFSVTDLTISTAPEDEEAEKEIADSILYSDERKGKFKTFLITLTRSIQIETDYYENIIKEEGIDGINNVLNAVCDNFDNIIDAMTNKTKYDNIEIYKNYAYLVTDKFKVVVKVELYGDKIITIEDIF